MGILASPSRLECDIVDHAMRALTGIRMQSAVYIAQLDTDDAGRTLSVALTRPVALRSVCRGTFSERYFVDVESGSGSAVATAVRMTVDHSTAPPAARVASVGDPVFFDSLIVAALDAAR